MTETKEKSPEKKKETKPVIAPQPLSAEDQILQETLFTLLQTLHDPDAKLQKQALSMIKDNIKSATASLTSVPKPLKFLREKYDEMKTIWNGWKEGENKKLLADILSILAMTYNNTEREALQFRLKGSGEPVDAWGHEYVRQLASEIISEFSDRTNKDQSTSDLLTLIDSIVPFCLTHNAEADACDLLLETEQLKKLPTYVDANTYSRVCLYLLSCVKYVATPDDQAILRTVHTIYFDKKKLPQALTVALSLNDNELIKQDVTACEDPSQKKQLLFMLARQQHFHREESDDLNEIIDNAKLSEHYLEMGKQLDILEPKTPEDIYKTHLENSRSAFGQNIDSARQNLAATYVNGFVNAGFKTDTLMTSTEETSSWIYKNKDRGMMSAVASMGLLYLWDVEDGLAQIDKYLYASDPNIKAGALLAIGLVSSGVHDEADPAIALLAEHVMSEDILQREASITGLGIAYAGSARKDVLELLLPILEDHSTNMVILGQAALALGMVFVGTSDGEIASAILQLWMEKDAESAPSSHWRFVALGLALLYMGRQESCEATIETLKAIDTYQVRGFEVLVDALAYAGTGNVLKVQEMMHVCNEHIDNKTEDDDHQAIAVLGIATIAMGEDIGLEMALRQLNHLLHYGEPVIRKTVPLALGLMCVSNPLIHVVDTLSRLSHDNDQDVSLNACFALGLVGAGTNNARLAQMLRQLATYYAKETGHIILVRVAQGLLHAGKGTLSLRPYHTDRGLLSPVALSGLLATLVAMMDNKQVISGQYHYYLFYLVTAMYPRFLVTLDEDLKPIVVNVRVGQALDVVGQAGRPKTISGFQTHSTPVLLGHSERAELATEEYITLSSVMEGIVILRKNPAWVTATSSK